MTRSDIEQVLLQEVCRISGRASVGVDELFHEIGMDSLGFIELLLFIEITFDFKLEDSGLDKDTFRTVRILADNLYEKLN